MHGKCAMSPLHRFAVTDGVDLIRTRGAQNEPMSCCAPLALCDTDSGEASRRTHDSSLFQLTLAQATPAHARTLALG